VELGVGEGVDVGECVSGDGTLTMSMVTAVASALRSAVDGGGGVSA
jgi:hypothetical protein